MDDRSDARLSVFVKPGCRQCERARGLAREVEEAYPQLDVRVVDVSQQPHTRDDVFATPTFLLNDRLLSLGNPPLRALRQEIEALLQRPLD
ncbi:MAG: thioredoxin family protein [Dehalococcoidia bacterium]